MMRWKKHRDTYFFHNVIDIEKFKRVYKIIDHRNMKIYVVKKFYTTLSK